MRRFAVTMAVVGVAVVMLAACGDGSSSIGTTTTTTRPATNTTEPSFTIGIICSTPAAAADSLVAAWTAGDRAAAARCATATVVTELFRTSGQSARWSFQACGGPDPGVPVCRYTYPGGSAQLTIEGTEAVGWRVTKVVIG
jgi:hypothetical protein